MPSRLTSRLFSRLIVVAAVTLLELSACGSDAGTAPSSPSSQSEASSPSEASPSSKPSKPSKPSEPAAKLSAAGVSIAITVAGEEVSPEAEVVEVEVGEPILVTVRSDRAGELHIHSTPEQLVEFGPGRTTADIEIDRAGSVDVEEHDSGALVAKLLVR